MLIFGIPFLIQIIFMVSVFASLIIRPGPDTGFMFEYAGVYMAIMVLFNGLLFAWYWCVAIGLQSKVPQHVRMKLKKFKTLFLVPVIYLLLFCSVFIFGMVSISGPSDLAERSFEWIGILFIIVFPLHLFSMFCIFYSLYFVAKTLRTVELQREVSFSDFAGEFFLIWFYPIGIWIIQPRINKIVTSNAIGN